MKNKIRLLNEAGISELTAFLIEEAEYRRKNHLTKVSPYPQGKPTPHHLLSSQKYSRAWGHDVEIEDQFAISRKRDIPAYLNAKFESSNVPTSEWMNNQSLWNWLSLFFLDKMDPPGTQDGRINRHENYILEPDIKAAGYIRARHRLYTPFMIFHRFGGTVGKAILDSESVNWGDVSEQICTNPWASHRNILEAIDKLYWANNAKGFKTNSSSGQVDGSLRRFNPVTKQLLRLYDVYSMDSEEILDLLPDEFDAWHKHSPKYSLGLKRLTAVELDKSKSHQHEIHGLAKFKGILGPDEFRNLEVEMITLKSAFKIDNSENHISWYDRRIKDPKRSAEWVLYYKDSLDASPGDLFIVMKDSSLESSIPKLIIISKGHPIEEKILEICGLESVESGSGETAETDDSLFDDIK